MALSEAKRASERDGEHGEGTLAFTVTKPMSLDVLHEEVRRQFGWEDFQDAGLIVEGDPTKADDSPVTVWVRPPDAPESAGVVRPETNAVKALVGRHAVVAEDRLGELVAKANSDEALDDEEMREAVTLMLKRIGRTA